jgi:hypothetical protein
MLVKNTWRQVANFLPGYKTSEPRTKIHTLSKSLKPIYKNFKPSYKNFNPSYKNFKPSYEISNPEKLSAGKCSILITSFHCNRMLRDSNSNPLYQSQSQCSGFVNAKNQRFVSNYSYL